MGLSVEQVLALQDDLITGYEDEELQRKLRALATQVRFGDRSRALEEKEAALLEVQKPIVAKYGFAASAKGVQDAMRTFSSDGLKADPDVFKKMNRLEGLLTGGEPLDWYMTTFQLCSVRNFGHERPLPRDRFPIVEYQETSLVDDCRAVLVPRSGMLSAQESDELAAACKRGDVARAAQLLGIRKVGASARSVLVNIGYKALGPLPVKTLAQALAQAVDLEVLELDISGNNLGPEGIKVLVAALPKSLKVLKLNVANNRLMLAGVKLLMEGIPKSLEVLHLGFAGMKMGPDGARAIAAGLPPRLRDLALDLAGNGVQDEGVVAISKALPKSIEDLNVTLLGNQVSRRGYYAFDRQIGDPLHDFHLPLLTNERFKKSAEVELEEFRVEADGHLVRQLDWRSNF